MMQGQQRPANQNDLYPITDPIEQQFWTGVFNMNVAGLVPALISRGLEPAGAAQAVANVAALSAGLADQAVVLRRQRMQLVQPVGLGLVR